MIPCCGGGDKLRSTLDSLIQCERPETYSGTWIIENGVKTDVELIVQELVSRHPEFNFRYRYVEKANKSNALNVCVGELKQPALIFLTDDDIKFDSKVLVNYASAAQGKICGTVFGGSVEVTGRGAPDPDLVPLMPTSMLGNNHAGRHQSSFFLGANWAAFSEDIIKAGGFDPRFGPGSDPAATGNESTMMRALQRSGCSMQFIPDALVWHFVDYTKITADVLNDRRHRSGVERGIRLAEEYRETHSPLKKTRLRAKVLLSHWLSSAYQCRADRSRVRPNQMRLACRSCYHRGINVGWHRKM